MLEIHLITLIVSVSLGIIFAFSKWKSILIISILYYGVYTYQFIKLLSISKDEILLAALFCLMLSHGPFLVIFSIVNLYKKPNSLLELLKNSKFRYCILAFAIMIPCVYIYTHWNEIRCRNPKFIDVYSDDANYMEEIKVINKTLKLDSIRDQKYDVIRLYYLPSFQNEVVIEVKFIDTKITSAVKYYTVGKSIWDDQQADLIDSKGHKIGGRVKGVDEYESTVNVRSDTIVSKEMLAEANSLLTSIDIFNMRSISVVDEKNCVICAQMDGNSYVVISKRKTMPSRYFEFDESKYADQRYIKARELIEKLAANNR